MLKQLSLKNFRAFKDLTNLEIKPVTILCGTNSCGKSSILNSILLLKQTLESQNPNQILLLNGRFTRLGDFSNLIFQHNIKNVVTIELKISFQNSDLRRLSSGKTSIPLHFLVRELFPPLNNEEIRAVPKSNRVDEYQINYKINLKSKPSDKFRFKPTVVQSLQIETRGFREGEAVTGVSISLEQVQDDKYKVKWENIKSRLRYQDSQNFCGEAEAKLQFANLFPNSYDFIEEEELRGSTSGATFMMRQMNYLLQNVFSSYSYIGPLREKPSRRYIYEDEIIEIGVKGENAAFLYLSELDKTIKNSYFYDQKEDIFIKKSSNLAEAVQDWLNYMGIYGFQSEPVNEIIYLNLNASHSDQTRVSIADVGFGVSQVFPIILEGLRIPKGGTLLLEQPEIHLHPNLQMRMADYFIATALSGKNLIVETHSDHIINRLVRRIVEDKDNKLNDLIGIYFITPAEEGSLYEKITIDDKYGIVNWPDDFFDQVANEQQKIMRAGLNKRKAMRNKDK